MVILTDLLFMPFIHHIDSNSIRAVLGSWEDKGWVIEYEQELTLRSFPI